MDCTVWTSAVCSGSARLSWKSARWARSQNAPTAPSSAASRQALSVSLKCAGLNIRPRPDIGSSLPKLGCKGFKLKFQPPLANAAATLNPRLARPNSKAGNRPP